jgi:hypothetical protein
MGTLGKRGQISGEIYGNIENSQDLRDLRDLSHVELT